MTFIWKSFFVCLGLLSLSSCVISHSFVLTNNPVGSKQIVIDYSNVDTKQGVTYHQAIKQGNISKIGLVERKTVSYFFFTRETMVVRGE